MPGVPLLTGLQHVLHLVPEQLHAMLLEPLLLHLVQVQVEVEVEVQLRA